VVTYIYIALGGALGSLMRYLSMGYFSKIFGNQFPFSTLLVNVIGSLLIGIITGIGAHFVSFSPEIRALLVVGILGGFTTFSSFSLDIANLYSKGDYLFTIIYAVSSVVISLIAVFLGVAIVRLFAS